MRNKAAFIDRALDDSRGYWHEQLAGELEECGIPLDFPRSMPDERGSATLSLWPGVRVCDRLQSICGSNDSLLHVLLLAALNVCIGRYNNLRQDVRVGIAIRRVDERVKEFNQVLIIRQKIAWDDSFQSHTSKLKQIVVDAYDHQLYPYKSIVEMLRSSQGNPAPQTFNVAMALDSINDPKHLRRVGRDILCAWSKCADGRLHLEVEYHPELMRSSTVEEFGARYLSLLEDAVHNPLKRLRDLGMVHDEEQERQSTWNETRTAYPRESTIADLFEESLRLHGSKIAVTFADEHLTYSGLNERANKVAVELNARGIREESRVGICLDRSLEMIVAILGIIKAGAAYVPLDPRHPEERLQWMISDSGVKTVLCSTSLRELCQRTGVQVICLDVEPELPDCVVPSNSGVRIGAQNLAYVMYTSGSTGVPKGVAVTHRNVVRLVRSTNYIRFDEEQVWLQFAPVSFDASTLEIWGPLLNGGRLVVFSGETNSLEAIGRELRRHQVTTLWLTAGLFHLVAQERIEDLCQVRQLLAGGDVLQPIVVEKVLRELPQCQLTNGYGPTEGTTFSCCYNVPPGEVRGFVPIGKPIANTQVYVLDDAMDPMPLGAPGELYIGGDGVARGYLDRPDLTAEKFIPNRLAKDGDRLYRTGDRCRYLRDGNVEFLGRWDRQVKFNGFRVELDEIRTAINSFTDIADSVVAVYKDDAGQDVMVAYCVSRHELSLERLRTFLEQKLIRETVPNLFFRLETIPLTLNGKVDYEALPRLAEVRGDARGSLMAVKPGTATEEILAAIWSQVLGIEHVGVDDSFFDLGGHSLQATRIVSRVRSVLGVELPVRALFEAPTVAGLAHRIAGIKGQDHPSVPPVTRASRNSPLPLSYAQQRLWFIDQLETPGGAYNIPVVLKLQGPLDVECFHRTLSTVVQRHEILRTRFDQVDGKPGQYIEPAVEMKLEVEDLRSLDESDRDAEVQRWTTAETSSPFHLTSAPLLRARLLRLADEEFILLLVMHHIVSDGWSMGVLVSEVGTIYAAFLAGRASPLPELQIQYADYAVWQRAWLQGQILETELSYWREQLKDLPFSELPADRPWPSTRDYLGKSEPIHIPHEIMMRLRRVARAEGVTIYMLLLAAFQMVLSRWTGCEDLATGCPVANRNQSETEALIGFFVNQLVLRGDLTQNPTFSELLVRMRKTCLSAYAHQNLPFERLVEELIEERNLAKTPFFQAMLVLQNAPLGAIELKGLTLSPIKAAEISATQDLTLALSEIGTELTGALAYRSELYDPSTIQRFLSHLSRVLYQIGEDATTRVGAFEFISQAEKHQLLQVWNETASDYPADQCVHRLFESQVDSLWHSVALVAGVQHVTYGELNRRSNRLAHYLQRLGIMPEMRVGILLERSPEMAVAILAVLKSGGAYIPLDPEYPAERLAFMICDAGTSVLVTRGSLATSLVLPENVRVLNLEELEDELSREKSENLQSNAVPQNTAYVIYTSGSTGRPKGVLIEHQNVVASTSARFSYYSEPVRHLLSIPSFAFDVSVAALFWTLLSGGTLHISSEELARDPARISGLLVTREIEHLILPPVMHRQLLVQNVVTAPDALKKVIVGGEQCSADLVAEHHNRFNNVAMFNEYGPTEATTWSTVTQCCAGKGTISIGTPISNAQAHVLGLSMELVPLGGTGELYLGGAGLSRGYLNRVDLTAERFVPNQFSQEPGARLYKTGDLAKWRPDGQLEYLGRKDEQVKIRSYRIELGEIEETLRGHPDIQEAAIAVREDHQGQKQLVGCVVKRGGSIVDTEELVKHLRRRLPDYMIPQVFVEIDTIPVTPSGKLDRRRLAESVQEKEARGEDAVALPRTAIEEVLCGIWADLLQTDQVSIERSFFELGGHSLLATQMMSRVRDVFQVELPLQAAFEQPTIARFARKMQESEIVPGALEQRASSILQMFSS